MGAEKYVMMPNGFRFRIEPAMTEEEYFASGAHKYLPYRHYQILCRSYQEIRCFEKVLQEDTATQEEWDEWAQLSVEALNLRGRLDERRRQYQI